MSTADGHLVRLLDERAAAQSTPRREQGRDNAISFSTSATDSGGQPQYYQHHPQYPSNVRHPQSNPMRKEGRKGGGVAAVVGGPSGPTIISQSVSASTYPSRTAPGDYSIDQYSHDVSDSSSRYSESSGYTSEDPRKTHIDPPPSPPGGHQPPHSQHNAWRQHEYGRNLQYANESYGDDSTAE